MKAKFLGQVETNFQGGPRESELPSSSKYWALSEAVEMIAAVHVPGENDKKLDLQFNGTRWGVGEQQNIWENCHSHPLAVSSNNMKFSTGLLGLGFITWQKCLS